MSVRLPNRLPILATEIIAEHAAAARAGHEFVMHCVEAGRRLTEAKELVAHGEWQDWLTANVPGVSLRTAQRYMRAAARVGKNDTVSFSTIRELTGPEHDAERNMLAEPFIDFDFEDHPDFPNWLQHKLAHVAGLPQHVRAALSSMDDYDLPALSMCLCEDIAEAMKIMAAIIKEERLLEIATTSTSMLNAWVVLKIAAQRIFVTLWQEVVEERKKLTDEQLWQRSQDTHEKLGTAIELRCAGLARAKAAKLAEAVS